MKWWTGIERRLVRLGVGMQLFVVFAIVLGIAATVTVIGLMSLSRVESQARELSGKWLPGVGSLASIRAATISAREQELKCAATPAAGCDKQLAIAAKTVKWESDAYRDNIRDDEERALFDAFLRDWATYLQAQQHVMALAKESKRDAAVALAGNGDSAKAIADAQAGVDKLWEFSFAGSAEAGRRADATHDLAWKVMAGLAIAALTLGSLLAFAFVRLLRAQLGGEPRVAAAIATAVAQGDLGVSIELRKGDDRSLMAQLKAMQQALRSTVGSVRTSAQGVASASLQIAHGNGDLSRRTEQQAAALQQTTASMEQLGTTVKANADDASQANALADGAVAIASRGGTVMADLVQTMKGLSDASRQIADIIGLIDGIAFQTNILALNAAVEAARAGAQGRGFAVVASEVRSLAQRSAEAAKEIRGLISNSVQRVEQGNSLVQRAGETMNETVEAIRQVTELMHRISHASADQSGGVSQIVEAIRQMDQTTQQNAALVEQSAAAAESLKAQAQQLVDAVAAFRMDDAGGSAGAPRSSSAAGSSAAGTERESHALAA